MGEPQKYDPLCFHSHSSKFWKADWGFPQSEIWWAGRTDESQQTHGETLKLCYTQHLLTVVKFILLWLMFPLSYVHYCYFMARPIGQTWSDIWLFHLTPSIQSDSLYLPSSISYGAFLLGKSTWPYFSGTTLAEGDWSTNVTTSLRHQCLACTEHPALLI